MSEWEELKEHLRNLLNCLINLAPTRNRFSQMLFIIEDRKTPITLAEARELWPEIMNDVEKTSLLRELGIYVGEKIIIRDRTFADKLRKIIDTVFIIFEEEKYVNILKEILGDDLPNLEKEWFKHKLSMIFSEPTYGEDAKRFLKTMYKARSESTSWEVSKETIIGKMGIDETRFYILRDFLEEFKIIEKNYYYEEERIRLTWEAREYKDVILELIGE